MIALFWILKQWSKNMDDVKNDPNWILRGENYNGWDENTLDEINSRFAVVEECEDIVIKLWKWNT